jgi:hypothetical protein
MMIRLPLCLQCRFDSKEGKIIERMRVIDKKKESKNPSQIPFEGLYFRYFKRFGSNEKRNILVVSVLISLSLSLF